jgi:hypothetical protein
MQDNYDVVVVGGGLGGCSAAVGAAKEGAKTLLVEQYGFLGGTATAGLVHTFWGHCESGELLTTEVFEEISQRLEERNALVSDDTLPFKQSFDPETLKVVLDEMVQDYGVDLLFHSLFNDVEMTGGQIVGVDLVGKSGHMPMSGAMYVDGTADGDLAARAGAPFEIGRPQDGLCQPMTLFFQIGGLPADMPVGKTKRELIDILTTARDTGRIEEPYDRVHFHATPIPTLYGIQCNHIIGLDGTEVVDLTEAELRGRRQVHALFDLFKAEHPAFGEAYLLQTASRIGVRETRRIMGEHLLTKEEVLGAVKFPDGIVQCSRHINLHNPEGPHKRNEGLPPGAFYEIPFRCLVPQKVVNLLIGSRCISATHEAHASWRQMPIVCGVGAAAGIGAAWAAQQGVSPRELDGAELKSRLLSTPVTEKGT